MIELAVFAALGACEVLLLLAIRTRVRGTTLMAAWWWAGAATVLLTGLAAMMSLPAGKELTGAEALRYAAAVLTFCPVMAVLGAKRPQHHAWQFIVLSLWGVLALPAAEVFVLRRGLALEVQGVRFVFLVGLIALGALNWLPTRFAPAALFLAAGQVLLLAEFLSAEPALAPSRAWMLAGICFVAATGAVWTLQRAGDRRTAPGWDRVWRDFRNSYGALWALRVAERANAAAAAHGWPVRVRWGGIRGAEGASPLPGAAAGEADWPPALASLLRRFVSAEWIARRR